MIVVISALVTWVAIWMITFVGMAQYGRQRGGDFALAIVGFFVVGPVLATIGVIIQIYVW